MDTQESLSLAHRFEPSGCRTTHPSLPHPSRLVRLLSPIIFILLSTVGHLGYQLTMCNSIASQLIGNDLSRLAAVAAMLSLKPTGINRSKLDAPEADRFTADSDASFGEEVFYISVAVTTRLRLKL
jgi:hypothetical protein